MKVENNNLISNKYRSFRVQKWKDEIDLFEESRKVLFSGMGVCSILGWMGSIFGLNYSRATVFITILILSAAIHYLFMRTEKSKQRMIHLILIIFSLLVMAMPFSIHGIQGHFHDAAKTMSRKGILLFYQGNDVDSLLGKNLFLILLAMIMILVFRHAYERPRIVLPVLSILLFLMELRYGQNDSYIWFLAFLFILISIVFTSMRSYLVTILPILFLVIILGIITGNEKGNGWNRTWNAFRYHEDHETFPEGDLRRATKRELGNEIQISIDGVNSGYYYLKGFVGTIYADSSWKREAQALDDFETGIIGGSNEFLNLFHDKGCSGWNQLAEMDSKEKKGNDTESVIEIHNRNTNRKYLYLPYELTTSIKQLEKEGLATSTSGEALLATGVFGKKNYRIKRNSSILNQKITGTQKTNSPEYNAYAEYVNRTCLILPREVKESLRMVLGGSSMNGSYDTVAVVKRIRRWLKDHVTYDENPGEIPDGKDFASWFFEGEDARGYDIHYASAAVILFRYYGIPARYVEGYLVEDTSLISEQAFHAWPEIYVAGVGWIPVEVMESYEQRMPSYLKEDNDAINTEKEDKTLDPKGKDKIESQTNPKYEKNSQQEKEETTQSQTSTNGKGSSSKGGNGSEEENKKKMMNRRKGESAYVEEDIRYISLFFKIIFVLFIPFLIVLLFLRFKEMRIKRWATESISPERCIIMWYQYCTWLLYELEMDPVEKAAMEVDNRTAAWEQRWKKYHPTVSTKTLHQVGLLKQKAIYRKKGIDWSETEAAQDFLQDEYRYFYGNLTWKQKWKVRLGIRPAFLRKNFLK
ncbi:MAG: transglutaminase domain-containing protein [Eubacteriales bacterium]|nr:transglutaminase domain-containing protein [Eubacteriales bacterium]